MFSQNRHLVTVFLGLCDFSVKTDFLSQGFLRVCCCFRESWILVPTEKVGASRSQGLFAGVRAKIHVRVFTVSTLLRPPQKVAGAGGLCMILRCTGNLVCFLNGFMISCPSQKVPGALELCMVLRCASDNQYLLQDKIIISHCPLFSNIVKSVWRRGF